MQPSASQLTHVEASAGRPEHERPYLLIPIGYPSDDCVVPKHAIWRKDLADIMVVDA